MSKGNRPKMGEGMKVVVLHGTYGGPEGNWFPWLKKELEKLGHEVFVPKLPTPEGQSVEGWCKALREQCPWTFGSETVLVGHSCGATYMLNILNRERAESVCASIFVSGFLDELGTIPEYDRLNYTFVHQDFDWDLIRKYAGEVVVFHGDNDPYVPVEQAEKLAGNLGVKPTFIKDGGHLNAESGYTEFSELMKKIEELTSGDLLGKFDDGAEGVLKDKKAVRAVVRDGEGKVAILHVGKHGYYKIPGGGVEEGESDEEAVVREVKEEAGVDVKMVGELGRAVTNIGGWGMRDLSRGYVVEVVGEKGEPKYEDWEKERGFCVEWRGVEEAIDMMKKNVVEDASARALQERDLAFLEEFYRKENE